jgi:hypothetical protein
MKQKGFIFSIDALFAVAVATLLVLALVSMQEAEKGSEKAVGYLSQKSRDRAIIDSYLKNVTTDSISDDLTKAPYQNSKFYSCAQTIRYNIITDPNQGKISETKKCEALEQ